MGEHLEPSDTQPITLPIVLDPDGLLEQLKAFDRHPSLRPNIPKTLDAQLSAEAYIREMEAKGFETLGVWQEFQLQEGLDEADRLLRGTDEGPLVVYTLEGQDPKPRDAVMLNLWLALLNRDQAPHIQDQAIGDRRYVAKLVIFRE